MCNLKNVYRHFRHINSFFLFLGLFTKFFWILSNKFEFYGKFYNDVSILKYSISIISIVFVAKTTNFIAFKYFLLFSKLKPVSIFKTRRLENRAAQEILHEWKFQANFCNIYSLKNILIWVKNNIIVILDFCSFTKNFPGRCTKLQFMENISLLWVS